MTCCANLLKAPQVLQVFAPQYSLCLNEMLPGLLNLLKQIGVTGNIAACLLWSAACHHLVSTKISSRPGLERDTVMDLKFLVNKAGEKHHQDAEPTSAEPVVLWKAHKNPAEETMV